MFPHLFYKQSNSATWAGVALGLGLFASQSFAQYAAGPFSGMSGNWFGGGSITMTDGSTERVQCRATYATDAAGRTLTQNLRCASDSYNLNISTHVVAEGASVSGSWSETSHGDSGSISGHVAGGVIQARIAGGSFLAGIGLRVHGNTQSIRITPYSGVDVSAVSISLRRG